MEQGSKVSAGERESEDMQEYLARINKQLDEMQSQLQTVAPRRESLARATERYLQRRASGTDAAAPSAPEATMPTTSATTSARPSRNSSPEDVVTDKLTQQPSSGNVTPKPVKYKSDGGFAAATPVAGNSPTELVDIPAAAVSPATTTPPRALSKELSWELQSQQLPGKQSPNHHSALFHSPQYRTSSGGGNASSISRQRSESMRGKISRANSASLAAAFEAAAAGAEEVEGSRVCIISRNASENGSRAGSRIPSFKWQQPTPQNTPEKASNRNGGVKPPKARARSQSGHIQQQQQQLATAGSSKVPTAAVSSGGNCSPVCSRSNSARFASTGGTCSSRRFVVSATNAVVDDTGIAAAVGDFKAAARATSAAAVEPQSEHELFAVINDAMEAAAAAVNKPEILVSSPGTRRFTSDNAVINSRGSESSMSVSDAKLNRQGSSLKGLATAATQLEELVSHLETDKDNGQFLAEQQQQHSDAQVHALGETSESLQSKQQQQQKRQELDGQVTTSSFSVTDICGSEIVRQGSSDATVVGDGDDNDDDGDDDDGEDCTDEDVCASHQPAEDQEQTPPAVFDEADVTTIDMTAAATAVVQAEVASAAAETERSTDAASAGLDGNCPNQLQKLPMHGSFTNNHGGSSSSSSLSPWRRLVSDPGIVPQHTLTKQQQQWETPTKEQQMCDNPPKQQQQQQQQGVGSPGKQQSGSWSPSKQLKQLKSWFSDIRRSPSQQGSPQRPRHASDSGYIAAAAASGGSAGMLFTKAAQSPARTLSSSGFGCHVEDLPLRLLGQSGSIRSRSSSGSQASLAAAAAAVRFDAAGSGRARSSSGGSVSNQQLKQQQQMPELEPVAQMSSSPAAAADISDASAAYSKPLPNVGTRLLSSVAPAAASAEAVTTTTAAAAADTSMHASAPAMLEGTPVSTYCSAAAASSLEDAEHDDVLFGSPAGSPASSYSHLNFQQRSAAAVAASRLSTESTAAGSLEQQAWQQHRAQLLVTLPQPGHDTIDYAYTSPAAAAAVAAVAAAIEGGDSPAVSDVEFASPSLEQQNHIQEGGGSSSSSSSVEISTSLGSSSSSSGLGGNAAFTCTAVDEVLNAEVILDEVPDVPTFLTHGACHQLVRQDESVAGDAAAASADTVCGRSLAITTGIQACSIDISQSISPMAEESQLLEQQCDPAQEPLWQEQQQEDVVTHDPGITAAAAAAAGLSGHIDYNASFLGPEATEGSAEIVVEGHSMQIPDYAAIAVDAQQQQAAAVEYVVATEVATATAGGIIQPVVTSKQQHYDCYSQHHLQQQQQQRVLSGPDHDSSAAAPLPAPDNAGKPSWTERMLGKVAAALKPTSSRSRVKSSASSSSSGAAVAAGAITPEPLSMCSNTQPVLASSAAADSDQQQPERQQQQQQQQCIEESQSLSAASFLAAVSEPVVDAAVPQHPQHQLYDSVIKSSSSSGSSADTDVTCLRHYPLARAAAVAITGIGLSAVQGTPKPHIVACGSTMHAPTLACVSMLLASTSCTAASSSSGNAHAGCTAVEAAAAAVSLAVAAAAVVAAWLLDVNGNPEQTAGTAGDSVNSPTAVTAVAKQLQLHAASPTVGVQEKPTPALPAVPGVLSPQPAAEPSGSSSSSSIETSDLPELIADVSKTQYSRPGTAEYDAGRYTEPLSPIGNADSSTSTDSTVLTSPPHTQQQQKQQGLVRPQGQQQQMHQQQQQLRRIQLSGSSWSPCKSPRAADAAPVVWLQQMTSHWGLHHNQQQQLRGPSEALSLPASGRELASSSSRRAVSAVQQLKQRQLNRRSTIGASSTAEHAAGMTGNAVHMQAALQTVQQQQMQQQHMEQQQAAQQQGQQQQVQQQQHQLPLLGPGEMCLGHGIMGASLPHDQQQQQQQQWFKEQEQQQQQQPSPIQELSCTDYYRQLVQQQQEQQQTQQQHTDMDSSSLKPRLDSTSSLNSSSSAIATAGSSGGSSGGSRQLAALARLRQQRHQRLSQQASFQGDSVITAAAAAAVGGGSSNSKYTIAAGEWGSGGGAEHAEGDDGASEQQQYQPAAAAAARAAWGDPTAPAAAEYMPPQQQQQHLRPASHQQQVTSSSRPPSVPNSASAAAAVSSRGWSTDTGASAAGDTGDGDTAAAGSSGSGSSAKPFLKRKSRSIVSQKLDWSSVPSRTVHKLDDRYVPPSKGRKPHSTSSYNPALAAAQSRAGLMSAAGRSTAAAAAARGSSANSATGRRTPHAGYEPGYEMEIRSSTYYRPKSTGAAAAGAAVANGSGRRSSPATTAAAGSGEGYSSRRGGYAAGGMAGVATAAGVSMTSRKSFRRSSAESDDPQQKIGRVSAGDGAYEGAALDPGAPLDDLLNHVNNLIKEFDRMYK